MNTIPWLVASFILFGSSWRSLAAVDSQVLSRDLREGKFEIVQQITEADSEVVLHAVRNYLIHSGAKNTDPALRAFRKIPSLAHWLGQDIQKRIAPRELDLEVFYDFHVLGELRTPEAVGEIGRFINDDTILKSPSEDVASSRVSFMAAGALSSIGFENAPTPNESWGGRLDTSDIKKWQAWWKENEGQIDRLVKQANASPPPALGKRNVPQSSLSTPQPSAPTGKPTSMIPILLAGFLVIVGGIVFYYRRKA